MSNPFRPGQRIKLSAAGIAALYGPGMSSRAGRLYPGRRGTVTSRGFGVGVTILWDGCSSVQHLHASLVEAIELDPSTFYKMSADELLLVAANRGMDALPAGEQQRAEAALRAIRKEAV